MLPEYWIVFYASLASIFGCALVGAAYWKRIPGSARLFAVQAFLAGISEIVGYSIARLHLNNHGFFNVYLVLDFFVILFASRDFIPKQFNYIAPAAIVIFAVAYVFDLTHTGPMYLAFHAITLAFLMLGAINLMILLTNLMNASGRQTRGINIISGMLLAYYFCTIPRFGLLRYFLEFIATKESQGIMLVNVSLSFVRYVLTGIGLFIMARAGSVGLPSQDRKLAHPIWPRR